MSPHAQPQSTDMFTYDQPDARGHFGPYGGTFVSETLILALSQLRDFYEHHRHDESFKAEFRRELANFVGRPSGVALSHCSVPP